MANAPLRKNVAGKVGNAAKFLSIWYQVSAEEYIRRGSRLGSVAFGPVPTKTMRTYQVLVNRK